MAKSTGKLRFNEQEQKIICETWVQWKGDITMGQLGTMFHADQATIARIISNPKNTKYWKNAQTLQ